MIIPENIVTELNNILLTEGVETKNMKLAKHYLYDKMGYDEKQAMKDIGQIKTDIPNSRLGKCKFMLGLVRMYCNGEINNDNIKAKLNQTLEYVASDKYINNFNQDLNGLSCSELISQFEGIISQDIALRKDKMSQEQHTANNLYNIVKIDSFKEAKKYSRYCDWCITQVSEAFDKYGGNLITQFYFCLKKGFENEKAIIGDGCPLDSYGLSMIAVSIRPDGSINTCTCRWNHDNGGSDHIMNDEQLSKLLGINIYDVLKPREKVDIISLIEEGGRSLESIAVGNFVIPEGVKCIGACAFKDCSELTSITIPNSVTSIGDMAFSECSSLKSITIPNSVTSIGEWAFQRCSSLKGITIPNSVTSIEEGTFESCYKLTSINIPNSITEIGYAAFSECSSLKSITIPNSVTYIGEEAFELCYKLTNINISNSVTVIDSAAFINCRSLTSITIPNSVTSIGEDVFSKCPKLTVYVDSQQTALLVRGSGFEGNIQYLRKLDKQDLESIAVADGVKCIGDYAFFNRSNLKSITIPDSVTSIGEFAFYECSGLTSITIPDSVTSIGMGAFADCTGLTSITIPDSVTTIGVGAFSGCKGLTSITIPDSVTNIGKNAFSKYPNLTVYVQSEQTANLVKQTGFRGNIQYVNNQGMHESMRQNRLIEFISKKILNNLINEVRYIDTKENKYNGRVTKTDWKDIYNQEPIKNNDRIRVYHGCTLKTALDWALHGTSGREWHPRTYSYESGMNPLGIFVTVDFEKAKDFGYDNECKCIVEFTAIANDLESPVWNGSDSYFGQGSNPQPFKDKEERNAQKAKYDADARNIKDYSYWDNQDKKEKTISYDHIRQSDKPAMAKNIFDNPEHQALFMGNLNPNMIKRIWINQREDGKDYVSTDKTYVPLTVKEFVKKYKDHEFYVDGSYGNEKRKLTTNKLYKPNEDFKGWQDFIKRDKWLSREEKYAQEFLKDLKSGNDYIKQSVSDMMFPKQIIQAFGQEFFDTNYNRLGQ